MKFNGNTKKTIGAAILVTAVLAGCSNNVENNAPNVEPAPIATATASSEPTATPSPTQVATPTPTATPAPTPEATPTLILQSDFDKTNRLDPDEKQYKDVKFE